MNIISYCLLINFLLLLIGCHKPSSDEVLNLNKASLSGGDQGIFTIELEEGSGKIHFGYTVEGNIIFNGHVGAKDAVQYHNFSRDSMGSEILIADVSSDGIPDYWIKLGANGEVLGKVPFAKIESPF